MRIPITIRINGQITPISALIDSGAEGNFIQQELVDTLKIHQYPLKHPIQAQNVDGTPVKGSNIRQYAILPIKAGTYFHPTKLLITGIGKEQIILGHPWLQRHNPRIDWKTNSLTIRSVNTNQTILEETPPNIPQLYNSYFDLFRKSSASRFPPARPYDHAIDLKPDFLPSDCSVYSLTPREKAKHDEFITENLAKGFIRPSKSPQASPFFFVGKKDGDL